MKIAIIGGGPAGIAAATFLKNFSGEIHLFEQNANLGEKLKLTGGGRMNVTNKIFAVENFISGEKNLLKKIFKNPIFRERENLFAELGIKYKWEENRAILQSENGKKEVERLQKQLADLPNLQIKTSSCVTDIRREKNGNFSLEINKKTVQYEFVLIASGGMLRLNDPLSSEKEHIYSLASQLGHSLTPLSPALCPLLAKNPLNDFPGTAFLARITDLTNKKALTGFLMLTHIGFSGPLILDFSLLMEGPAMEICFLPSLGEEDFINDFKRLRTGKNSLRTYLKKYLPTKLVDFFLQKNSLDADVFFADCSKEKEFSLRRDLYNYRVDNLKKAGFEAAWTTSGGIKLNEIKSENLESKLTPNLFFAGEILDISGFCGGYNISFAIISAKIVAEAILKKAAN